MSRLHYTIYDLITALSDDQEINKEDLVANTSYYEDQYTSSNNLESLLALSACVLLEGDYKKAHQILDTAAKQSSQSHSFILWYIIGIKYHKTCKYKNAIEAYKLARQQEDSLKAIYFLHIKTLDCLVSLREYKQAIEYFAENSSEIPQDRLPKLICKVGFCYEQLNLTAKAIECYNQVGCSNNEISKICDIWAKILQGNYENLLEEIQVVKNQYEENTQSFFDCKYLESQYYIACEQYDEAFRILQGLVLNYGNQEYYQSSLGHLSMKCKNLSDSFLAYLKAASSNQHIPEIWYNLAVIYAKVGQCESESAFNRAKNLDPTNVLPISLEAGSDLAVVRMDWSTFGQAKKPVAVKKKVEKGVNRTKPERKEIAQPEIIIPTPIKSFQQPIGSLPFVQSPMFFKNQNMLALQKCLNFFEQYNKSNIAKEAQSPTDTLAAEILTKMNLPCKRNRSNSKK
ncbi:hypothetical protein SteCoe_1694 [Stentor coeruleus]|uniref:Uncharacterized protein n=1 Tax=Stentor coeruleus TaxID=5963 RepID=A0A1R2D176_9CILI|nr:hypothetical protein SteCoe_1694 [Stentor coeruleus]